MKAYWAIFSARFRILLQYRAAAWAGVATQLFWGLIRVMIFAAFYASSTATQPMSYGQVVTYVWFSQALLMLILFRPDPEVAQMIRTGAVAYELVRPVNLYGFWVTRALASCLAPLMLRAVPILVVTALTGQLLPPASAGTVVLTLLSIGMAAALAATFNALFTVMLLRTVSGDGINRLVWALTWLLSGVIVPVPLFPASLQPLLAVLPFRALMDTPLRIYLGHASVIETAAALGHQALWVGAIGALGAWMLARDLRRLVVQGG